MLLDTVGGREGERGGGREGEREGGREGGGEIRLEHYVHSMY